MNRGRLSAAGSPLVPLVLAVMTVATTSSMVFSDTTTTNTARVISLPEALRRALNSSESLDRGRRELQIRNLDRTRALTLMAPRLSVSGSYERPQEAITFDGSAVVPEDTTRATITATQPLLEPRFLPRRRQANLEAEAARRAYTNAFDTVLTGVADLYYRVLRAAAQIEVAEQTVDLTAREVARARKRFEAGETRRTELLRVEVEQARARRGLVEARNDYALLHGRLARDIGMAEPEAFDVAAPPEIASPTGADLGDLYEQALLQRSDLAAARHRVRAAREELKAVRSERWPSIDLRYDHRFIDPESFASRDNFWELTLSAELDLWDGGDRGLRVRQQAERYEQARLDVRELEKQVRNDVQMAVFNIETLEKNQQTLQKEVDLATQNYQTLSEQARVGLATSLDVSTALTALDRARTDLTRLQYSLEAAKLKLQTTLGSFGAWFDANVASPAGGGAKTETDITPDRPENHESD